MPGFAGEIIFPRIRLINHDFSDYIFFYKKSNTKYYYYQISINLKEKCNQKNHG